MKKTKKSTKGLRSLKAKKLSASDVKATKGGAVTQALQLESRAFDSISNAARVRQDLTLNNIKNWK
jgi:hypothetical protein